MSGFDEIVVLGRLLADGHSGWSVPDAVLRHWIPLERQTSRFLFRRFRDSARVMPLDDSFSSCPKLFGKPRWLIRKAIAASVKYRLRRIFCQPQVWVEDLLTAAALWGRLNSTASPIGDLKVH
jgi:hypothetical protein